MKTKDFAANNFYVWFDTEYSDLDLESARLLQVAALITDASLKRVLPREMDVKLAIKLADNTILSPWVEQNLSELVSACRSSEAVDIAEADKRLAAYVDTAVGSPSRREGQRPFLAGNSIHADWWFVYRDLPRFRNCLHYRHLDVTSFKLEWQLRYPDEKFPKENPEMIRRYFPEAVMADSDSRHDAYYDLQASIAEMAFYRRRLIFPPEGNV